MDRYFYSVEKDVDYGKVVHLSANVYFNDDNTEKDYRCAEWCGEYLPISQLQQMGVDDCFYEYANERIKYLGDISRKEANSICRNYTGARLHINNVTADTPCGDYYFDMK